MTFHANLNVLFLTQVYYKLKDFHGKTAIGNTIGMWSLLLLGTGCYDVRNGEKFYMKDKKLLMLLRNPGDGFDTLKNATLKNYQAGFATVGLKDVCST